ncbi:hypothetical protein ABK040_001823 [Willaertia magna]
MLANSKHRLCTIDDLNHFDIQFEALLDNETTFNCFTNFLSQSYNKESASFLIQVNEYRKIKYEKTRLQKANAIYEEFVKENAKHQINIKSEIKTKIITILKQMNNNNNTHLNDMTVERKLSNLTPSEPNNVKPLPLSVTSEKTLFDEAELSVLISLKENQFKNFLESNYFKDLLLLQNLQFLYDIGNPKESSVDFSFLESFTNLKNEFITKNDLKFLKDKFLQQDEKLWDLVDQSKNHKTYLSTTTFDFGDSIGLYFIKFEVTFPYPIKQVLNTMCEKEYRLCYDPNLKEIIELKYINKSVDNSNLATIVTHERYKLTWPFDDRDFFVRSCAVYDKTDNVYIISKLSLENKELIEQQPKKKGVIIATSIGGWAFQSIDPVTQQVVNGFNHNNDNTHTKYYQLFYLDFKGKIPKGIVTMLWKKRAKAFYKLGMKYLKINEERGFKCEEDNKVLLTLEENGMAEL